MRARLLAVALCAALGGCNTGPGFAPPASLDADTWLKVDRTVEKRLMGRAARTLDRLGLDETFGAAYEFLRYKPQFFLGAGKGAADRRSLLDAVLPLFGGELGVTETPRGMTGDSVRFLCAPYSQTGVPGSAGTGLASIAAACTWSDGETAGFGVGVAGPSVEDVLRLTDEARTAVAG